MVGIAELGRALRRPASVYLPYLNRATCSADSGMMSCSQAGSKNICDTDPTHGRNSLALRHVVVNSVWGGMSCHSARSPLSAMPTHTCAGDLRYLCYGEMVVCVSTMPTVFDPTFGPPCDRWHLFGLTFVYSLSLDGLSLHSRSALVVVRGLDWPFHRVSRRCRRDQWVLKASCLGMSTWGPEAGAQVATNFVNGCYSYTF